LQKLQTMDNIKKILVGLDHTKMDDTLIQYTHFLVKLFPAITHIYFVNVIKSITLPEEVVREFPDLIDKAIEERKEELKNKVEALSNHNNIVIEYIIETDTRTKFIMEFAEKNDVDLIVIGRKLTMETSSVTVPRLARRASCNLLIIPEGTEPRASSFLIPVDFSEHSKIALEIGIDIAHNTDNKIKITCQKIYAVPAGYHYTGKSFEEFAMIMKSHAQNNFKDFIQGINTHDLDIEEVYSLDEHDNLPGTLAAFAQGMKADWIILGAKGLTSATALFIGSFAEKLINILTDIPIFIARPKGKNAGIMDIIKEM